MLWCVGPRGDDLTLKINYASHAKGAYPIVLVTYEIVCSKGLDAAKVPVLKAFLKYLAQSDTQKKLADVGYAQVPDSVLTKVNTAVDAIS